MTIHSIGLFCSCQFLSGGLYGRMTSVDTCFCSDASELMESLGFDRWRCTLCGKEISRRGRMTDHIEVWHLATSQRHSCATCGKSYLTKNSLQNHQAVYHKSNSRANNS